MAAGLILFLPASIAISYPVFLFALFIVGSGLALLQVAINPYVGALGRPDTAAQRITICGFLNSLATTLAPKVGAAFIFVAAGATAAELAHSVRTPVHAAGRLRCAALAIVTWLVPLPDVLEKKAAGEIVQGSAWSYSHLRFGALAIFTYVGAEVAIGSVLINYLGQPAMGALSHQAAASYVAFYWGGAMVGRFIGSFALLAVRAERALAVVAALCAAVGFDNGPWSRTLGRACCRRLRALQLRNVAVHLPTRRQRPWQAHQPGLRHSRHDGGSAVRSSRKYKACSPTSSASSTASSSLDSATHTSSSSQSAATKSASRVSIHFLITFHPLRFNQAFSSSKNGSS